MFNNKKWSRPNQFQKVKSKKVKTELSKPEIEPVSKLKCPFCNTDKYENQYSQHLKRVHADIMSEREQIRALIKKIKTLTELKKVKQIIINLLKENDEQ